MRYRVPIAAVLAGLLVLNGCASQRPIPTERIQAGHIEEVLPPSTRVRVGLRSGDEIIGRVQSSTDSTVTVVRDPLELVGHASVVVVRIDEVDAISVVSGNPLQYALGGLVVGVVLAVTVVALSLRDLDLR